jgi:NADH-quinone oxidoreductase subunit L
MEGPTPVSALLHAATMVAAGVFLVVRADPLFAQAPTTRAIMLGLGAATALFAACLALVQTDIKKVLAYSTCSQLGYMIAALGAGAVLGGFFHLTTHAFFKALLFLAAGSAIHAVHSNDINDMGGLARRMPLTACAFVVGALALAGFPGLSGFFSKDMVLEGVAGKLGSIPWAALMVTAFLTAFYMGRVVFVAFFGNPSGRAAENAHEPGWSMRAPLVVLGLLAAGGGVLAAPFAKLYGASYHFTMGAGASLAAALGIAGFAASYLAFGRGRSGKLSVLAWVERLARTSAFDRVYELLYRRVALAVADALGWFDRYVVDGIINLLGYSALEAGSRARMIQTGFAPDYVLAAMLGVVGLAFWAVSR